MMLFNPACLAAQTNTAPSAQPLSEALEPAENSAQLTDKGYSSYQRALLYASFETPEGDLAAQNELNNAENLFRQAAEKTAATFAPSTCWVKFLRLTPRLAKPLVRLTCPAN